MKLRIALAAGAAMTLAACGSQGGDKASGEATAEASAPASAAAAATSEAAGPVATPAKGSPPTKEFMVGKWGEAGDCTFAIDFRADGTTDGPFGDWKLENGVLTMGDSPQKVHVTVIDEKSMDSKLNGEGESKVMTRC